MGVINVSLPSDGETIDAADYNTPINTIVNEINGELDNANLASDAAIDGSKLADNSIDLGAKTSTWDGWIGVTDTWTYASSTTVTVPTDATAKYSVGDKVTFDQSGAKYFQITAVASTTLTLFGIGGATVANASISSIKYSKSNPVGYSQAWQDWTPTWTNMSVSNSTVVAKYIQIGKTVHGRVSVIFAGGNKPSGAVKMSLPVTPFSMTTVQHTIGAARYEDAGSTNARGDLIITSAGDATLTVNGAGGTYATLASVTATAPHTWGNGDWMALNFTYEAA